MRYLLLPVLLLLTGCATPTLSPSTDVTTGAVMFTGEIQTGAIQQEEIQTFDPVLHVDTASFTFNEYIPAIMFHYVDDIPSTTSDQLRYRLSFSPQKLEKYLQYFQEHNIETLTYRDLKDIREGKREKPARAVMLTFDDGHADHYTNAFPLLQKYDARGVFFVIASKPDKDGAYATRDQIREMEQAGHEIASHTMTHPDLRYLSQTRKQVEIVEAKQVIEKNITRPVISFCYPAGKYNNAVLKMVKDHYLFARTTHSGKYINANRRYLLPTIRIFPQTGMASLRGRFPVEKK